ncbi:MAG: ABC transporter permease [Candidatus Bathyarchaeia archaeon]
MSLSYTFKRLVRSWRLFIALLLGIVLASTFFAGINVGADTAAWQALDQQLSKVPVDVSVDHGYYGPSGNTVLSSKNVSDAVKSISSVQGITHVEAISTNAGLNYVEGPNFTTSTNLIGVSEHSLVCDTSTLGENETYVWAESPDVGKIHVGDVLSVNITAYSYVFQQGATGSLNTLSFVVNLKVVGFVHLGEQALSLAFLNQFSYPQPNLLITSWEKTFAKLLDVAYGFPSQYNNPLSTVILVFVDRSSLISPWDVAGSADKVAAITAQINERVSTFGLSAQNNLAGSLNDFQSASFGMRFIFIVAALPVFFVAWYMGSTVSDVSFNLRRREIGLLLTKGFSRRQLWWMFLFEAALIGLLGGLLGILLSFTFTPWFVAAAGTQLMGAPVLGLGTIILTLVFAVTITFLSVYRSARRASNMVTVDALREYVYVEEVKPYRRLWPWAAFLLGSFKMVVFLLGINLQAELMRSPGGLRANAFVFLLLETVVAIDFALNYVGPFLFFWGITKIFISGSLKFQEITARAASFLGDMGKLATKAIRRNPARAAAVAFLIAFIIGYSFQVVGTLASEQDLVVREARWAVGSDVSLTLSSPANASQIMSAVRNNVSHVQSMIAEYSFTGSLGAWPFQLQVQFRAVNPETWLSTAYYENDLFSGSSVEKAFEAMNSSNHTIILDRGQAEALNKTVGDVVAVTFGDSSTGAVHTEELTVVGFFGLQSAQTPGQYWSYVPEGLYNQLEEDLVRSASAKILIKLQSGTDSKAVADQVRESGINGLSSVSSVDEQLTEQQSNLSVMGPLSILRLGVLFMVVAASIGTALVTLVSLRERKREASIMSVRGLSFKQLLVMLLTESLTVVTFAMLLGTIVGLIVVRGIVASNNAMNSVSYSFTPLNRHVVFPPDAIVTLFISFVLVFASTIIPVILMAKRYSSRLERTVREV